MSFKDSLDYQNFEDWEKSYEQWKSLAKNKDPLGLYLHGMCLREGYGCSRNQSKGVELLKETIETIIQISKGSMDVLMNINGNQRAEHLNTSHHNITSANILGFATFELGMSYMHGWGISKNKNMAVHYIGIAAALDDFDAQQYMGYLYERGIGVKKSKSKAAAWYRLDKSRSKTDWIFSEEYKPTGQIEPELSIIDRLQNPPYTFKWCCA